MSRSQWGSLERRGQSWEVRFTHPATGKKGRKVVGKVADLGYHVSDFTRDRLCAEVKSELLGGTGPQSLASFFGAYKNVHRMKVRESTFQVVEYVVDGVAGKLGKRPMESIDVAGAENLLAELSRVGLRGKPLKPNTIRAYRAHLSTVWAAAVERGAALANPFAHVGQPRRVTPTIPSLTAGDIDKLVATSEAHQAPLCRFLSESGLRISEAGALEWRDVLGGFVVVHQSKTGQPRHVPLTDAAKKALASVVRDGDRVFPFLGTKGQRGYQLGKFHDAVARAKLPHSGFHTLRHSLGYRLARAGCSAFQISKVLGNSENVAKRYMGQNPTEMAQLAMDRLVVAEQAQATGS